MKAELGSELGEQLVPMVNGGVGLHKIFGLMHDTCNTANRVAQLMADLRETKARSFYGDTAWDAADTCVTVVHDFLCGNHSRNLLVDRANKLYDAFLERNWVRRCVLRVWQQVGVFGLSVRACASCAQSVA